MTTRFNPGMLLLAMVVSAHAQTPASQTDAKPMQTAAQSSGAESLDRIVAIVNQDLVLESDVQEEMHFGALQPYRSQSADPRQDAIDRLINRALILQQERLQPQEPITDDEVNKELLELRKQIPVCQQFKCETEDGWKAFLASIDFTEPLLQQRWRERMEVLRFIELRFRSGIQVTQAQIADFYNKTLLPQYAKQKATPPALETVSPRIEEVLLQREVTDLLNQWLESLKKQGSVRILKPGEEAP